MTTHTHGTNKSGKDGKVQNKSKNVEPSTIENVRTLPAKQNSRRKVVSYKDLAIQYMVNGEDALTAFLNDSNDPVSTLEKVIDLLGTMEHKGAKDLGKLLDFYRESRNVGQPGRQPVKTGDARDYTVQQVGEDGDLFVRIPLNTLDVQRGMKIRASFEADRISIVPLT